MMMRSLRVLMALFLVTALPPVTVHALQVDEFELRTAYLYNFALFTTWPADWPPENGTTMAVCTLGEDRFGAALEQLHNRKVRGKRLVVRRSIALEQASACHMLYIAESERQHMAAILESLRGTSVLTISEAQSGDKLKEGDGTMTATSAMPARTIISLVLENRKLMFEVDSTAARQAGLTMSSRLLYLARRVY
jgi:hypothetical protein